MNQQNDHVQDLAYIRSMMEQSSRFLSLSGLSGVLAGIFALIGSAMAYLYMGVMPFTRRNWYIPSASYEKWGLGYNEFFFLDAGIVLVAAIAGGLLLSKRKANKAGQKLVSKASLRLMWNMLVPLIAGGLFCIAMLRVGYFGMIAPATLIFYGLALLNGSKYTLDDVRWLGYSEIALGLIAAFLPGFGLMFWTIGFGVLHIVYGLLMYFKYER